VKKLFNWLIVLGACVGAFYCVGLIVPRSQVRGCRTNLATKPAAIYATVADLNTWSDWHPEVAAVQKRPARNDHPVWLITTPEGEIFELEVTNAEEAKLWQGSYTREGTRTTLRFDFNWYGEGGRARVTMTEDTRDTWLRAKRFLLPHKEVTALGLLLALTERLGESTKVEETD
jgi:hypothetical protein